MRTKFEIVNQALYHIGQNKIESLTGSDPSTVACNEFFESVRDDIFREFQWPFATVQQPLSQSVQEVPLGWTYAYDYPADNIATVWYVFNESTAEFKDEQDFEVYYIPGTSQKMIVSNLDAAYMEYTYIVSDTLQWDAKFDIAMSYRLAATICPILAGDTDKALGLTEVYNAVLSEAKRIAASEKRKKPQQGSKYFNARG